MEDALRTVGLCCGRHPLSGRRQLWGRSCGPAPAQRALLRGPRLNTAVRAQHRARGPRRAVKANAFHGNNDEGRTGADRRPGALRLAAPIPQPRANVKSAAGAPPAAKATEEFGESGLQFHSQGCAPGCPPPSPALGRRRAAGPPAANGVWSRPDRGGRGTPRGRAGGRTLPRAPFAEDAGSEPAQRRAGPGPAAAGRRSACPPLAARCRRTQRASRPGGSGNRRPSPVSMAARRAAPLARAQDGGGDSGCRKLGGKPPCGTLGRRGGCPATGRAAAPGGKAGGTWAGRRGGLGPVSHAWPGAGAEAAPPPALVSARERPRGRVRPQRGEREPLRRCGGPGKGSSSWKFSFNALERVVTEFLISRSLLGTVPS